MAPLSRADYVVGSAPRRYRSHGRRDYEDLGRVMSAGAHCRDLSPIPTWLSSSHKLVYARRDPPISTWSPLRRVVLRCAPYGRSTSRRSGLPRARARPGNREAPSLWPAAIRCAPVPSRAASMRVDPVRERPAFTPMNSATHRSQPAATLGLFAAQAWRVSESRHSPASWETESLPRARRIA